MLYKIKAVCDIGCGDGIISKSICTKCFSNCKLLDMFEPFVEERDIDGTKMKTDIKFETTFYRCAFDQAEDGRGKKVDMTQKYDCVMLITALHHILNPENII